MGKDKIHKIIGKFGIPISFMHLLPSLDNYSVQELKHFFNLTHLVI